jgi:hypothetical protein
MTRGFASQGPPLRTTSSQLQCIVRDILYNDFIKFNVHSESFIV